MGKAKVTHTQTSSCLSALAVVIPPGKPAAREEEATPGNAPAYNATLPGKITSNPKRLGQDLS